MGIKNNVGQKASQCQYDQQQHPADWGSRHSRHHGHTAHRHSTAKNQQNGGKQYDTNYDKKDGLCIQPNLLSSLSFALPPVEPPTMIHHLTPILRAMDQ